MILRTYPNERIRRHAKNRSTRTEKKIIKRAVTFFVVDIEARDADNAAAISSLSGWAIDGVCLGPSDPLTRAIDAELRKRENR